MGLRARARTGRLGQQDRKFIGRDAPATELQIVSAEGSLVRDVRGRTFIDFVMGWCCGNLGWNAPELRARLAQFSGPDYVLPSQLYAPWVELAQLLADLTPDRLERCFRATTGTEAVEFALQLARAYTGRDKIISITDDFHGSSIAVKAIGHRIHPPLDEHALPRLERALEHRLVAALIMEPIIMNLGVAIPTLEFMQGARALCETYGTLFIADEVASGFGRTGTLFACEQYGLEPDVLCLAKALSNGTAPIGAMITTAAIADKVDELEVYATFGWHPLACEAALAVCETWRRDQELLLAQVAERSDQFAERLAAIELGDGAEVRIKGLAIGIDLPAGKRADEVIDTCRDRGLLITGEEHQLTLFPALTIDRETAANGLEILAEVLAA